MPALDKTDREKKKLIFFCICVLRNIMVSKFKQKDMFIERHKWLGVRNSISNLREDKDKLTDRYIGKFKDI